MISEWVYCPICGNKTRLKIRGDTELKNFPLFCPKCKRETLITVKQFNITVIKEPDAEPITHKAISLVVIGFFLLHYSIGSSIVTLNPCGTVSKNRIVP
ncbi:hypothetical protein B5E62_04520 [Lachnoclostridium sp. An118]|nr:hypothetical protein B5E62_04520 [Lachnoclostridium sp. An118]